jgi:hypothetical protein
MASELIKIAERERSGINDGDPGLAHGAPAGLSALVAVKPGRDSARIRYTLSPEN